MVGLTPTGPTGLAPTMEFAPIRVLAPTVSKGLAPTMELAPIRVLAPTGSKGLVPTFNLASVEGICLLKVKQDFITNCCFLCYAM